MHARTGAAFAAAICLALTFGTAFGAHVALPSITPGVYADGHADGEGQAPCPDFFFQDPLPVEDWPVLAAADSRTAWAVTYGGLIIKSQDGESWDYQWSDLQAWPDTPPLRDVCVVSPQVAWICGDDGSVLVTVDGGGTWDVRALSVPDPPSHLYGISALDDKVAWVVGDWGSVFRTVDGGLNWTSCPLPDPECLYGVSALSGLEAWVCGDSGLVAVTADGGATWQSKDPGTGRVSTMRRIRAFDAQRVHVIGNSGCFFSTSDGGDDWDLYDHGGDIYLFGMSFADARHGWISGTDDYQDGFMAVTADGGGTWTPVYTPLLAGERNVTSIALADGDTVWSCTVDGALMRSDDGGGRWKRSDTVFTRETLLDVCAIDARSAWMVGSGGTVLRTFNGGMTWVEQYRDDSLELNHIDAWGSSTAWAAGHGGAVIRTEDYGAHWTPRDTGTAANFDHVAAVGPREAWVSGMEDGDGVLLHTADAGKTWQRALELPGCPLSAVSALDARNVWFGSVEEGEARVYRTEDGGSSWRKGVLAAPVPVLEPVAVAGIHPVDENLCLALAVMHFEANTVVLMYRTEDGGVSWAQVTGTQFEGGGLFNIATVDGTDIWGCGAVTSPYSEPTTVFHSDDGGDSWSNGKNFHRTVLFDIDTADGRATWTAGYISAIQRSVCPSLFSVSPDQAPNTGSVEITDLAGSYFWEGMEVWLEKDGNRIDASSVEVLSPYRATCRFQLAGAEAGTYDVVARNANGLEDRLPGGFTVTSQTRWYLPEGSTGGDAAGSFETWIVVENPNAGPAEVALTYMTPRGEVAGPRARVAGMSRLTVNVGDALPGEWSVATMVTSDLPVTAARATYWSAPGVRRTCAHASIGTCALSRDWYLAEGSTGGDATGSFETWITVQNPGDVPAQVGVTYLTLGGPVAGPRLSISPRGRANLDELETEAPAVRSAVADDAHHASDDTDVLRAVFRAEVQLQPIADMDPPQHRLGRGAHEQAGGADIGDVEDVDRLGVTEPDLRQDLVARMAALLGVRRRVAHRHGRPLH
jgi:photosystem II stability/assembly factor-like uncharacterized protein